MNNYDSSSSSNMIRRDEEDADFSLSKAGEDHLMESSSEP